MARRNSLKIPFLNGFGRGLNLSKENIMLYTGAGVLAWTLYMGLITNRKSESPRAGVFGLFDQGAQYLGGVLPDVSGFNLVDPLGSLGFGRTGGTDGQVAQSKLSWVFPSDKFDWAPEGFRLTTT